MSKNVVNEFTQPGKVQAPHHVTDSTADDGIVRPLFANGKTSGGRADAPQMHPGAEHRVQL